jgi:hypothetical protein
MFGIVRPGPPANPAWATGRGAIRKGIISAFGEEAAFDVLDAWMWPKFTYQGTLLKK